MVWKRLREELYPTIQKILQHQEVQAKTVERLVRGMKEEEKDRKKDVDDEDNDNDEKDDMVVPPGITIPTVQHFLREERKAEYLNEAKAVENFLLAATRRLWQHPEEQDTVRSELEICGVFEFLERNVTGLEVEHARNRLIELELIISQIYSVSTLVGVERDRAFTKLRDTLRNSQFDIDVLSKSEVQRSFSPPPPPPPAVIVKTKHENSGGVILPESELGKDRDKSDARSVVRFVCVASWVFLTTTTTTTTTTGVQSLEC